MLENLLITTYRGTELKTLISDCIKETLTQFNESKPAVNANPREILTRQETAEMLGISLPTLHSYTKDGLITAFRLGFKVRYRFVDVFYALKQINVIGGKP